jgi:hypothetical protein
MQIPDTWLSWEHLQWLDLALPFFFLQYWGLNLGPSRVASPFFVKAFSRQGLENYLPQLASNSDPSDLCLLSNYDYKQEPPTPGLLL